MKYELGWIMTRDPIVDQTLVSKKDGEIRMTLKLNENTSDWSGFVGVWDSGYRDRLPTVRGGAHQLLQLRSRWQLHRSTTCGVVGVILSREKKGKKCWINQHCLKCLPHIQFLLWLESGLSGCRKLPLKHHVASVTEYFKTWLHSWASFQSWCFVLFSFGSSG